MKRLVDALGQRVPRIARAIEAFAHQPVAPVEPAGKKAAYAHWGEDLVVGYFLGDKKNGFYVDIGCFHPTMFSNTKLFFDAGWQGVNVDPNPFMMDLYRAARPNDVNLQLAISDVGGAEIDYFLFSDWGSSNTASPEFAASVTKNQNVAVQKTLRTRCETLGYIFEHHCAGRHVDFLNIDVENLDLKVLQASDWERWRPTVIAIEDFEFDFADPNASSIYKFLVSKRYLMVSRNVYTSIFASVESGIRL